ncbi:MAG: nucleotide sugar dehydrogenase [Chloroflexota bacterium]
MKISIMGLGYVGCVSAACFARDGHEVVGVDVNPIKVDTINAGKSPIIEPGLQELLQDGIKNGRLSATSDAETAVNQSEIVVVCVGTPSQKNGGLDLAYVEGVCEKIGQILKTKSDYTVVAIRSTILPGVTFGSLIPIIEESSGKKAGVDFGFCVNPEFLREGTAIKDFDNPPYTIIGQIDDRAGRKLAELYAQVDAPVQFVTLGVSEMVKYASNAFHALKVAFANEIGNISKAYGVDSHQVMDIFIQDTKLNLSPVYLKPGFSFGGSCLPKDVRALLYAGRKADLELPVMEAILPSNELQTQKALDMLVDHGKKKIGLVGISFKPDTDDLRESPAVELAERLIGKGFNVNIYDKEVSLNKLHGSNKAYIDQIMPHIGSLMQPTLKETVQQSETIVIAKKPSNQEYDQLLELLTPQHTLIDLVRLNGQQMNNFGGTYNGICW